MEIFNKIIIGTFSGQFNSLDYPISLIKVNLIWIWPNFIFLFVLWGANNNKIHSCKGTPVPVLPQPILLLHPASMCAQSISSPGIFLPQSVTIPNRLISSPMYPTWSFFSSGPVKSTFSLFCFTDGTNTWIRNFSFVFDFNFMVILQASDFSIFNHNMRMARKKIGKISRAIINSSKSLR